MKYSKQKVITLIIIAGFLLFVATAALAAIGPGDGNLLKRSQEETCHACHKTYKNAPSDPDSIKTHSSTDTTKWPSGWGISGGKYGEIVCTTCHTPHDTKNIYLIRETITAPNAPTDQFPGSAVDLRYLSGTAGGDSGYYSLGDDTACYEASYTDQTTCQNNGGTWNSITNRCNFPGLMDSASCTGAGHEWSPRTTSTRVCEVCHSKNKYHNYNSNNNPSNGGDFTHNNAGDCTACHPHSAGFTPAGGACDSCHGNPPTTNTLGGPNGLAKYPDNSGTGSNNPGKHQYHATSTGLNYSCNTCHTNYVMPENTLKRIQIGFNIFGTGGGSYDGQTGVNYEGKNGTTVTNTGTRQCSNIYCHSSVQGPGGTGSPTYATPQWLDTATAQCGTCHKADGVQGNQTLMDSGSHTKHVSSPYSKSCSECHNGAGYGTSIHVNNNIDMAFVTDPHGNSGSYSQSPNPPGNGYGSCSNVYCHSIVQTDGGGALTANTSNYKNPTWGGSVVCGNCHSIPPSSGRHLKHADAAYYGFDCWACHYQAGINKNTGVPTSKHTDKNIDIVFDPAYGPSATYSQNPNPPGNGYGTCSTTYCHSNGTGGTANLGDPRPIAANTSPLWSGTTTCGSCHGGGNSTGQPNYPNGSPKANSHAKHPTDCSICHYATTSDGTTITNTSNHVNRLYNLQAKTGYSFSYSYQATGGSCSNASCHNDGTGVYTGTPSYGSPTWGASGGCNMCHGNNGYATGDYRVAAPLYASGSPKPNAHQLHVRANGSSQTDPSCANCHNSVTATNTAIDGTNPGDHANSSYNVVVNGSYRDGDNVGGTPITISVTYTFKGAADASTCSNVSCHPTGLAGSKAASTTKWGTTYSCTDCHNINMNNTTGYHHVMDVTAMANRTYPTATPSSSATDPNRKCTMCHVDHDIFSPMLNTSSTGRSYNLRTSIATTPNATSGYTNSDYQTGGGICISCHQNSLSKNTTAQKNDSTTSTPSIPDSLYSQTAHNYNVTSTMANGGSTFNANCSKCHNSKNNETTTFQSSTNKFGLHDNPIRRLLASLGMTTPTDPEEEDFCYRCHSKITDTNPGGGPAKATANKDWYGVANMSQKSEAIFSVFTTKSVTHPVATYSGRHNPIEGTTYNDGTLSGTARHAECVDCHNLHGAQAGTPLKGTPGVSVTNPATQFTDLTSTNYTYVSDASVTVTQPDGTTTINLDYKICLKCHSNWAYGAETNAPNPTPSATWQQTNMAKEFNVNNYSYHYVEGDITSAVALPSNGTGCSSYGPLAGSTQIPRASTTYGSFNATYIGQMEPTLASLTDTQRRSAKLRCSSCHGIDGASSGTTPEGPHGSAYAFILKVPSGSTYTVWKNTVTKNNNTVWCFNCHDPNFTNTGFVSGGTNLHTSKHNGKPCQNCHVAIPHGWKRYRLLRFVDCDSSPYNGTGSIGFHSGVNWKTSGTWTKNDCHSTGAVAGCG